MSKTYTTKTSSLKATTADIRKVDVHEINVWTGDTTNRNERVNLLDLIGDSNVIYDDRGDNITDNDIWPNPITLENTFITTDAKGNISINHSTNTYNTFDYSEMSPAQKAKTKTAAKVIDNKVYGDDGQLLMNWETAAFTNSGGITMDGIFGGTDSQKAPITEWDSDLSSLTDGSYMFYQSALESFGGDLSSLTKGSYMFRGTALQSFNVDLPSLTHGSRMFQYSTLESFNGDLSKLIYGNRMFHNTALTSFNGDLSSLTNGDWMFRNSALASFSGDLPSLTSGSWMFLYTALTSFNGDLPKLTNGAGMFQQTALASFSGDLSSLTDGRWMFSHCKLNAESVHNIIHFINPDEKTGTDEGKITIGTNIVNASTTLEAQKLEFAKTCLCDSWDDLNTEFSNMHWTVTWQFNGVATSTASTLELTDSNISTALWAKLEEVTEDDEPYEYVSEEDDKHYNIHWFHETNGSTDGYQYFGSLLEACGSFGVIPKEYAESNN